MMSTPASRGEAIRATTDRHVGLASRSRVCSLDYDARQRSDLHLRRVFSRAHCRPSAQGRRSHAGSGQRCWGRVWAALCRRPRHFYDPAFAKCCHRSGSSSSGYDSAGIERTYEGALNPQSYIDDVVRERGINLRGSGQQIQAVYNPNLASAGMSRAATPTVIEVGPLAMSSSDELARTLSHELNHARSWLKGGVAPESTAYAAEDALSAWLAGLR
jgi:hypothetical protein